LVNTAAGRLPAWKGQLIERVCDEVIGGHLDTEFPLYVWQTGSGTQSNMNVNEVISNRSIPALKGLRHAIDAKSKQWAEVVKIGRTHLEDATPLTVGQEWSGYAGALDDAIAEVEHATAGLLVLAMGGTAVGTGLNAPVGFGEQVADRIAQMTGAAYQTAANKFTAQGTLDRMVRAHAGLKAAEVSLYKIANDLRWLGVGASHRDR
jgi:fumarate hydratase class II